MIPVKYKSSSPAGDLISYMAGIRKIWHDTGRKGLVYQQLNVVGVGIAFTSQPFTNEFGDSILMGVEMFNNLRPLIIAQEYIEDYLEYKGEEVDFDFDYIRSKIYVNQPLGSLNRYFMYAFPEMNCDISEKWIDAEDNFDDLALDMVILNFTLRYRNNFINYFFLKKYESVIRFVGLPDEYNCFCKQWNLELKYLAVDNFLELSAYIKKCKFFLGNASMCYQIAEATKCKRILETCPMIPNVIPVGDDAYDFYHQSAVEYYFSKLINE